ncbi:MAG: AMP-binding protein, partial [Pseudomonadota bacterium]
MKVEYEKVVTLADVKRIESVSLEDRNLPTSTYQVLKESAADYADATAISFLLLGEVDEAPTNYTYADLFARVTQAANLFHSQGVGKTDVVSLILPNLPQTHFALWGGEAAGIAGPVNPMLEAPVIAEMLREVEAKVIVTIAPTPGVDIWEKVAEAAKDIPSLKAIYTIDPFRFLPGVEEARPQPEGMPVPVLDFDDACAAHPSDRLVSERQFEPTDVAAYFHTGGTTGSPKVAQHTHGMQVLSSWVTVGVGEFEQGTTVLGALPLFHVTGMMVTGLGVFAGGSTLAMMTPQGF